MSAGGWERAVTDASGGVVVDVEVTLGASASAFPTGFNAWRGTLLARLRAPPEKGKANEELVGLVAEALGVPVRSVSIRSGQASRRKRLHVAAVTLGSVLARLAPCMEGGG